MNETESSLGDGVILRIVEKSEEKLTIEIFDLKENSKKLLIF